MNDNLKLKIKHNYYYKINIEPEVSLLDSAVIIVLNSFAFGIFAVKLVYI